MQFRLSPHSHAELVLHKESVYHLTAPWFRVNFVRYEQNFNSGRRTMFSFSLELTKTIKQYAFFFFLPLFLKTKKKRDKITFSLENFFM